MRTIEQMFPSDAATVARFRALLSATRYGQWNPGFEREAAATLAQLGLPPVPGLTEGQSVLLRMVQLGAPDVPQEVHAWVAQATQGLLGDADVVREAAQTTATTVRQDLTENQETQVAAAEWFAERGIRPEGESPVHQFLALTDAAAKHGLDPTELARVGGLDAPPGVRAAERERALRGDGENSALHEMMEDPAFQAAAEQAFREHGADLAKLQIAPIAGQTLGHALLKGAVGLTDPSLINKYRALGDEKIDAEGYWQQVAALSGGAFGTADETRHFLESVAQGELHDRLILRGRERDAERNGGKPEEVQPAKPPPDEWRSALEAQFAKQEGQQRRASAPARPRTVDVPPAKRAEPVAEIDNSTRADLEFAWRKANGESLEGMSATPKVRAEFLRRPAESLRERSYRGAGEGKAETWRDALAHSWDRLEVQESGGDVEAFDAGTEAASGAADALEADASAEEAAA